jgi:hypothetical protein
MKERLITQLARGLRSEKKEGDCEENEELTRLIISKKLDHINVQSTPHTKTGDHTKFKAFNFDKRHGQRYTMPLCHFDTHNLWILKPTDLN